MKSSIQNELVGKRTADANHHAAVGRAFGVGEIAVAMIWNAGDDARLAGTAGTFFAGEGDFGAVFLQYAAERAVGGDVNGSPAAVQDDVEGALFVRRGRGVRDGGEAFDTQPRRGVGAFRRVPNRPSIAAGPQA